MTKSRKALPLVALLAIAPAAVQPVDAEALGCVSRNKDWGQHLPLPVARASRTADSRGGSR